MTNDTPPQVTQESAEQCRRCGASYAVWFAPSPLWNAVMRGGSIEGPWEFGEMICANCFIMLAEERGIASVWRVHADRVNVELETVTPSGRVWDDMANLWVEPNSSKPQVTRAKPDCEICGNPYHRHIDASGIRMCPISAVSYRPKRQQSENALREAVKNLERVWGNYNGGAWSDVTEAVEAVRAALDGRG